MAALCGIYYGVRTPLKFDSTSTSTRVFSFQALKWTTTRLRFTFPHFPPLSAVRNAGGAKVGGLCGLVQHGPTKGCISSLPAMKRLLGFFLTCLFGSSEIKYDSFLLLARGSQRWGVEEEDGQDL